MRDGKHTFLIAFDIMEPALVTAGHGVIIVVVLIIVLHVDTASVRAVGVEDEPVGSENPFLSFTTPVEWY